MMNPMRPRFLRAYFDEIGKEIDERSWLAVIPFTLIVCAVLSGAVAYFIPDRFWDDGKWEPAIAFYAGLLAFNALVLTLGWAAFARIYDVLMRGDFGRYLAKNNLLSPYIVHITYMHAFQILAALSAVIGLSLLCVDGMPILAERAILGTTLTFTIYAIKQAFGAVGVMNDLVWQAAYYEVNKPQLGQSNVVPLAG